MDTTDSNGKNGSVNQLEVPMMTVLVDPHTMAVTYKCTNLPIYFWQMVVAEVTHQLEEQRRLAAAVTMRKTLDEEAKTASILEALQGRR